MLHDVPPCAASLLTTCNDDDMVFSSWANSHPLMFWLDVATHIATATSHAAHIHQPKLTTDAFMFRSDVAPYIHQPKPTTDAPNKVFFQSIQLVHPKMRGLMPKPSALADWHALLPRIQPLVEKKVIVGFMLGDELVWNNISWVNLNGEHARGAVCGFVCFVCLFD